VTKLKCKKSNNNLTKTKVTKKNNQNKKVYLHFYPLIYQIHKNSLPIIKLNFFVPQHYQTHENIGQKD
jgi:hypothetical protein